MYFVFERIKNIYIHIFGKRMGDVNPWEAIPLPLPLPPPSTTAMTAATAAPTPVLSSSSSSTRDNPMLSTLPVPFTNTRDKYIESTLNESRAAEYFFNAEYQNDIMGSSDSRVHAATLMANNITNDISELLSNYVDIKISDELSRYLTRLPKLLIPKFFQYTKRVYIKGSLLALLDAKNKDASSSSSSSMGLLKQKADGTLEIDNGAFMRMEASRNLQEEKGEVRYTSNEETMNMIEQRLEKITRVKKATVFNINIWVYNELQIYQFANILAGASGIDNVNAIVKVNIGELVYSAWNEIYSPQFQTIAMSDVDSMGLYTIQDVSKFVELLRTRKDIKVSHTITEYIKKIEDDPVLYIKFILVPSYQVPLQRAWNVIENTLKSLQKKNPFAPGFSTYSKFVNRETRVPDMRLMLLVYPRRDSINAQSEFASLVTFYENQQRNIKQGTNATKNQIVDMDRQYDFILQSLMTQIQNMGFR